jgi:hypothetical protein
LLSRSKTLKVYILCPGPQLDEVLKAHGPVFDGETVVINAGVYHVQEYDWFCSTDIGCQELKPIAEHIEQGHLPRQGFITIRQQCENPELVDWCVSVGKRLVAWNHDGQVGLNYRMTMKVVLPNGDIQYVTGNMVQGVYSLLCAVDTVAQWLSPGGNIIILGASMKTPNEGDMPYRWPVERAILGRRMRVWAQRGIRVERKWYGVKH